MRKAVAGIISGGALFMAGVATPALAVPNDRACQNDKPHGTQRAHGTVPHETAGHHQAHMSIPEFCGGH